MFMLQWLLVLAWMLFTVPGVAVVPQSSLPGACEILLSQNLRSGDLIFSEVDNFLYRRVARVSGGWTSHVGIIMRDVDHRWVVYESRPPYSSKTPLCDFVSRNAAGRIVISRYEFADNIGRAEEQRLRESAEKRMHIRYDLWFDLDSRKSTFCSKFVNDVFKEALGIEIGRIESLQELLSNIANSSSRAKDLKFWKAWFLGRIPWKQRTLSPQSQLDDRHFRIWFDSRPNAPAPLSSH
jgi:hypothetical protein